MDYSEPLFSFLNTFPELRELGAKSLIEFRDGFGIATLWNLISAQKIDISKLKKPANQKDSITIMKNLRVIDQVICPITTEKGLRERVEFTLISFQSNLAELTKYISPLVILALSSPLKAEVVKRIKGLSPQDRKAIKQIIQEFSDKKRGNVSGNSHAASKKDSSVKAKNEDSDAKKESVPRIDGSESIEIKVRMLEMEKEKLDKDIGAMEGKLEALKEEENKSSKKHDQSGGNGLSQTEQILMDIMTKNEEKRKEIAGYKLQKENLMKEYQKMVQITNNLEKMSVNSTSDTQIRNNLINSIKLLEDSYKKYNNYKTKISNLQNEKNEIIKEISNSETLINIHKEEITTSIQLAEKYGINNDDIQIAENEANESVPELANRITQLELQLALLKDDLQNGNSGVPKELIDEQKKLKKTVKQLLELKKEKEKQLDDIKKLREELKRVHQLIVDQREEFEKELEDLTDDINAKNIELSNWISYSNSFSSWKNSSTFITELRKKYL